MTRIVQEDIQRIYEGLSETERHTLSGKTVLVTGYAGSLGYLLMQFLRTYGDSLGIPRVVGIDNFQFGRPVWADELRSDPRFQLIEGDITACDLSPAADAQLILHMASLASPVYYRLHPIETIDADVIGLRRLLDFYRDREIYSLLVFSTSEIYGNPAPDQIPTPETYFGYVNTSGPRACYDESKRFGETLCYNYHHQYQMPVTVIRPFNSFGPGLRTNDQRVVADFASNVLNKEDLVIYSDGKVTRTFCYASDTVTGMLKCALYGAYGIFNIGSDQEELSVAGLAQVYREVAEKQTGYSGQICYRTHSDIHYLTDNPQRRCPDLSRARTLLHYAPQIDTRHGVGRYLEHLLEMEESRI